MAQTVSIIIPVKAWQKNLEECINKCQELDFPDFEILVLPDENCQRDKQAQDKAALNFIPTGPVSPAKKRDKALEFAKGEILAFIDDDAYPTIDWLKNALGNFKDEAVAAVGGPAVTPAQDSLKQKASGLIFSSFLVSADFVYRYLPKHRREVDDYPSCNFLVRKSIMQALGGFDTNFWPGEDTKFCLDITKRLEKKIIYDPRVIVYHHRRPLFMPHLRQIINYALHRGYFSKKYPETSLKLVYFLPSIFVFGLFSGGIISLFSSPVRTMLFVILSLYMLLVLIFSIPSKLYFIPLVFSGTILTHIAYGIYFIKGLFSRKLSDDLQDTRHKDTNNS